MTGLGRVFVAAAGLLSGLTAIYFVFVLPLQFVEGLFGIFVIGYPASLVASSCLKSITGPSFKGFGNESWFSLNGWISVVVALWSVLASYLKLVDNPERNVEIMAAGLIVAAMILGLSLPACFNWNKLSRNKDTKN